MNAKVGNNNENYKQVMGKQGIGTRNENGSRLCEMCDMNDLVITGTTFPHRHNHLATWKSPHGTTLNQIDHTLVNKRFRNSVLDTRVMRSANIGSNHYLVRTTLLRLKLKRTPKAKDDNGRIRFDTDKLKQEVFRSRFAVTVRNKFEILEDEVMEGEYDEIEEECHRIEKCYNEAAKEVLGKKKRKKKPWISEQSRALIEQRNNLQKKIVGTRSERIKRRSKDEYKDVNNEVKRQIRTDKREWADTIASEAETAANSHQMRTLYRLTNVLCNELPKQSVAVEDQNGNLNKWGRRNPTELE